MAECCVLCLLLLLLLFLLLFLFILLLLLLLQLLSLSCVCVCFCPSSLWLGFRVNLKTGCVTRWLSVVCCVCFCFCFCFCLFCYCYCLLAGHVIKGWLHATLLLVHHSLFVICNVDFCPSL